MTDFCYAEFRKLENELSKTSRHHPDELDSNLTENNHECSYSPKN